MELEMRISGLLLARNITDLAGCEHIQLAHLAEALQYRPRMMETG